MRPKPKNKIASGARRVKFVAKILKSFGHLVYLPGFSVKWFGNKLNLVREDIFGIADILSMSRGGKLWLHQVTTIEYFEQHRLKIGNIPCYLWCDTKRYKHKKRFFIFLRGADVTREITSEWMIKRIPKIDSPPRKKRKQELRARKCYILRRPKVDND